jgi:hypothetical protein
MTVPREKYDAFFTALTEVAANWGLGYRQGQGFFLLNPYDGYLPSFRDVSIVEQGDRLRVHNILERKVVPSHSEPLKDLASSVMIAVVEYNGKEWAWSKPDLAAALYRLGHGPPPGPSDQFLERYAWLAFWHLLNLIKAGSVRSEADVVALMQRVLDQLRRP